MSNRGSVDGEARGTYRACAIAAAVGSALVGAASGFPVGGLVTGGILVGGYFMLFDRDRRQDRDILAAVDRQQSGRSVLWADAENALERLRRVAAEGGQLGEIAARLTRVGGRAVERMRDDARGHEGSRVRELICLAADVVSARRGTEPAPARNHQIMKRLEQVAAELDRPDSGHGKERALRNRLRVLERQLQTPGRDGMNGSALAAEQTPRDEASRQEIDSFLNEASDAFDLDATQRDQRVLVEEIKQAFDWETPERFADQEATGVSRFADSIIEGVRSSDLGSIHEHLTDLRLVTKRLGGRLEPEGFFGRLFFNGRKALEKFASDWDTVSGQIDEVIAMLESDKRGSAVTIENLRALREESIDNFKRMAAAIIAGRELLEAERERVTAMRQEIGSDHDTAESADIRRLEQRIDLFDRRLTNLEKSRAIAAGMIPTIQQTLHSEVVVSEELDMALTQTVPVMKQQLALTAEQVRQQERLQSLAATRDTTEKMMGEVADRLQRNQELVDEQVRDGLASADEVARFVARIGDTIDEIDRRQAEAQQDRAAARSTLQAAVRELGERLERPAAEAPHRIETAEG